MKLIWAFLLTGLASANLLAQTPPQSGPPDIVVKRVRWSQRQPPPRYESWPSPNPTFPQLESYQAYPPLETERPVRLSSSRQSPRWYVYSAEIRNGVRAIKAAAWEYVVSDRDSGKELARKQLVSFDRVGQNKAGTLTGVASSFPSAFLDAKGKVKYPNPSVKERVEFKCIVYKDDSSWCRPDEPLTLLDFLRRAASIRRR